MLGYYAINTPDTARAKDFYAAVFGWTYESQGDYHHIAGSSPAGGITPGEPRIAASFVVPDAAVAAAKARELGGTATEPRLYDSGWSVDVADGHGARLELWQPAEKYRDDNPKCGEGDLFYFVQPVADEAAKAFHTALLGWELAPGSHENGFDIVNVDPPGGVFVSSAGPTDLYFHVADVDATADRVLAAGGHAGPAQPNRAGSHAACRDDQGTSFSIGSLHQK
jgi:predicted enzyme related to lactoylglutathione lyase